MKILIGKEYVPTICELIKNAKSNIKILMYHWGYYARQNDIPAQKITNALIASQHKGISVQVLLHCGSPGDNLKQKNLETHNNLRARNIDCKFYKSSGTMHAKLVIIDNQIAIVGSHNFSRKSFQNNIEISTMVDDIEDIQRLKKYYDIIWSQI